jgi:putative PIN family toxin of toxin-antitoxin system
MPSPAIRVVLDTNIYISAALHGRRAETILELASTRRITLLASTEILDELEEKLRFKLEWPEAQIRLFLLTIRELVELVEPEFTLDVVPDDEDDNRIVECAVAGEAGLIVTFDKDLLRLKAYEMVGIITPRQLTFLGLDSD